MCKQSPKRTPKPWRNSVRFSLLLLTVSVTGCGTTKLPGSVAGLCDVYPNAEYAVVGKTQYDQDKVDEYVAVGTGVCGKALPKARPPSFDEPSRGSALPTAAAPPRKPSLWGRVKAKLKRTPKAPAPVAGYVEPLQPAAPVYLPVPAARPAGVDPPPVPAPAPAKRDRLDELLRPRS